MIRQQPEQYARFYDQVLIEIERGNTEQGLSLLVGMFDALHPYGNRLGQARTVLLQHTLHDLLHEAPLYAHAARHPGDHAELLRIMCLSLPVQPVSTTGKRLTAAIGNIVLVRALRQRQQFADPYIARAWRNGLQIGILGGVAAGDLPVLCGRDLSNVTVGECDADILLSLTRHSRKFDLIVAPNAADPRDVGALAQLFAALRRGISPGGTAIVSALLPRHIGAGWIRACLGWEPHVHAEHALRRMAIDAGFTAELCNDETNCIVWCVLRPAPDFIHGGLANDDN